MAPQKRKAAPVLGDPINKNKFKQGNLFSFFSKKPKKEEQVPDTTSPTASQKPAATSAATDAPPRPSLSSSSSKQPPFKQQQQRPSSSSSSASHHHHNHDNNNVQVGDSIQVYWKDDDAWYTARVVKHKKGKVFWLEYEQDGTSEWLDLKAHTYRKVVSKKDNKKKRRIQEDEDDDEEEAELDASYSSDESEESDDYVDDLHVDKDEDEDEDQWMVTDDEQDEKPLKTKKTKCKRLLKVTMETTATATSASKNNKTPAPTAVTASWNRSSTMNRSSTTTTTSTTPNHVTPALSSFSLAKAAAPKNNTPHLLTQYTRTATSTTTPSAADSFHGPSSSSALSPYHDDKDDDDNDADVEDSAPSTSTTTGASHQKTTQPASSTATSTTTAPRAAAAPMMFVRDAVNPAGSHVHHHLPFLNPPRDAQGRFSNDQEYDPRTLKVVQQDWEKVCGTKMTNAVAQWWELKAQYFDAVLLFKTGKFYELFHMDADIGVQVCDLSYMKGHVAHAGFPEISYATMAFKLVSAGYKVARVEQTETPLQLAERKKRIKHNKPQVVNREVCSILTAGTRTCCYLEQQQQSQSQDSLLAETDSTAASTGPLLVICEIQLESSTSSSSRSGDDDNGDADAATTEEEKKESGDDDNDDDDDDHVSPVCEYGVTLIDAVRGTVTLGQFADDVLRSRMNTLLAIYAPSEILVQGGEQGASPELRSLLRLVQNARPNMRIETIRSEERFPKSTAVDSAIRKQLERGGVGGVVHPWDVQETLQELHRRRYYPQASKKKQQQTATGNSCIDVDSVSRWPPVLKAAVQGGANLLLASFGAALFYLQRNLIDAEILSLGIVKAYIPPSSSTAVGAREETREIHRLARREQQNEAGIQDDDDVGEQQQQDQNVNAFSGHRTTAASQHMDFSPVMESGAFPAQDVDVAHMSLDGTTLHNLEILNNSTDYTVSGSLWSIINHTKTPHGSRLLRAWLLRPLFKKQDIDRRADAVQELVSGSAAVALTEAQSILSKCSDIERLLSRVHSMSGSFRPKLGDKDDDNDNDDASLLIHPNERAVLYETATYTKRKVTDFSRLLNSLRNMTRIPEVFEGLGIQSGLLRKVVRPVDQGGCFPNMKEQLDWFFENFDCELAEKGMFEPSRGIDDDYDAACEDIERIKADLESYKEEMCGILKPRALAKSSWKYINIKPDSKDKYLIELPVTVAVPDEFVVKGKRGSGPKQVNKYRTPTVELLVKELEKAFDVQKERKARGMQLIFGTFDSMRALWASAATATALLDALGSLAKASTNQGYSRPIILECPPNASSSLQVVQGRHPCVEKSLGPGNFVPNDLTLGVQRDDGTSPRILLLSGVNMGGKSTCLRQTCLIAILAQIGCFVPAEECSLTPVDRIYTRLGASDRILLGQSTFFVELAETAAALRGATSRSLVIMDELGRGTSTFDGTAIASATVQHLVERTKCLSLFATHYHSLLDEWQGHPNVQLGHMECVVENGNVTMRGAEASEDEGTITFLYSLGEGGCPKSFGINVARLARLPQAVVTSAKQASADFERLLKTRGAEPSTTDASSLEMKQKLVLEAMSNGDWDQLLSLYESSRTK